MTLKQAEEILRSTEAESYPLRHAMTILSVDGMTWAPRQSWMGRARTMGFLSSRLWSLSGKPEYREALERILAEGENQENPILYRRAELLHEAMEDTLLFSREEIVRHSELTTEADRKWHDAKAASDYSLFAPCLEKLIAHARTLAQRKDPTRAPYDVLLDRYEKGLSMAVLDPFFAHLRARLTPLIRAVASAEKPRSDFLIRDYPVHLQAELSRRVMDLMGLDPDRCTIGETEHPFTTSANKWDVRITTCYRQDVSQSMYSVLHEGGHALYELGVDDAFQYSCLAGGACMSIHESQSRFYENLIGRSRSFASVIFPVLREIFPLQLQDVTEEEWHRAVNLAQPSLIRTEADELTYSMHVMIRYEMEKRMIMEEVPVQELPGMWNEMYETYLGIRVPDDRRGILQDCHWSGDMFGYFPSYALGSAYGVQMLRAMRKDLNTDVLIASGDLAPMTAWLRERVHRHGKSLTPSRILSQAGVDPFDPGVYTDYLTEKYSELYRL